MGLKASHSRFTALAVFSLLLIVRVSAKDDCQPYKWEAKRELTDEDETDGPRSAMLALLPPYPKSEGLQAGQVNCRRWKATDEEVNHSTCSELAQAYGGNFDDFLVLNPGMDRDCQNIKPLTYYCVIGCKFMRCSPFLFLPHEADGTLVIEPLRALDGYCGPPHKNATCIGTETPCCNSETWTCGDTEYVKMSSSTS